MPISNKRHRPSTATAMALIASMLCLGAAPLLSYAESPAVNAATAESDATTLTTLTADQLSLLEKLDDADYMTRDLAMTTLLADDALTSKTLDQLYAAATSDEQRVRLRQVAVHHTARTISLRYVTKDDSAILGMSPAAVSTLSDDNTDKMAYTAILVRWTFPGSVAFAHLRQGDVITQVNGRPIPAAANGGQITSTFIQLIASSRAGDAMSFHVIRDDRALDIQLKLGSDRALQAIYQSARTAQSRQFNADVAQQIQNRLASLDQLAPSPALPLTLTLPAANASSTAGDDSPADAPANERVNVEAIFQ